MSIFDFINSAAKAIGIGKDEPPTAAALKKELDSFDIETGKISKRKLPV